MHPPHVSDLQVLRLITELTVDGRPPSGASLRAVLKARFGSRGGVSRIYRLLTSTRTATQAPPCLVSDVERIHDELQSLRAAATLAQHREEAHQARWALEIDGLRRRIAELEPLALQAKTAISTAELLRRQLHAAYMRISMLEEQQPESAHPTKQHGNRG